MNPAQSESTHLCSTDAKPLAKPLTQAQLGIWLGQQRLGDSPLYNAAELVVINGVLDAEVFCSSIKRVVAQADSLHQMFYIANDQPLQKANKRRDGLVEYVDLSEQNLAISRAREIANNMIALDLETPVNLERDALFKNYLFKLSDTHYVWSIRIHHIACDGYGFALLSQKVVDAYNQTIHLPERGVASLQGKETDKMFGCYEAILADDEKYSQSLRFEKSKQFWNTYLEGVTSPVSLAERDANFDCLPLKVKALIQPGRVQEIKQIAVEHKCSWPDVIVACVAAWFHSKTAVNEVVLGLPAMNRLGTSSVKVPAMVMNIAPLRVSVPVGASLGEVIHSVAENALKTKPHYHYRYEHIRSQRQKQGLSGRVYNAVVNVMPFDRPLNISECETELVPLSSGPVEDISFSIIALPEGALSVSIEGNPHLYDVDGLQRYLNSFMQFINEASTSSRLLINEARLSLVRGEENPLKHNSVLDMIARHVAHSPSAVAIIGEGCSLSYRKLAEKVAMVASGLKRGGVVEGDTVAIQLPRSIEAVVSCLACLSLRVRYVFIDPEGPEQRNSLILNDAKSSLVISNSIPEEHAREGFTYARYVDFIVGRQKEVVSEQSRLQMSASLTEAKTEEEKNLAADAYMVYTSGTTGTPKGVVIGQRALLEFVSSAIERYNVKPSDRVLHFAPLHFDASVEEIFCTLCAGATLVVRSNEMVESFDAFNQECIDKKITLLDLPTAFWHEWVADSSFAHSVNPKVSRIASSIHTVIIGGEAVQSSRLEQWCAHPSLAHIRLLNTYGPSEATVVATVAELNSDYAHIGEPLAGRMVAVVDETGRCVARGASGELWLLGQGLGKGYHQRATLTEEKFLPATGLNGLLDQPVRAYKTGDRVVVTEEGKVEYIGRLDDQCKISGQLVNPLEIEEVLLRFPSVQSAAVTVNAQSSGTLQLIAFVVAPQDGAESVNVLREYLQKNLPLVMVPSRIEFQSALPKNSAGKIDKKILLQQYLQAQLDAPTEQQDGNKPAHTPFEAAVYKVWKGVLNKPFISDQDDFFQLGGQSLQVLQVANQLSTELAPILKRSVPADLVFRFSVARDLAAAISNLVSQGSTELAAPSTVAEGVPSLIVQDCSLELELVADIESAVKTQKTGEITTVFLTGATGFVGAQIVNALLVKPGTKVICLVRAQSQEHAQRKLMEAMLAQGCWRTDIGSRVTMLVGDLEAPNFGIDTETLDTLFSQVNCVIHNAAVTSVVRDYKAMRLANTLSTKTALWLAAQCRAPLHFVSTVAVLPFDQTEQHNVNGEHPQAIESPIKLLEQPVDWHSGLKDGYQQSKWAAETIVAKANAMGYPASIYRLGRVTGEKSTGYVNASDLAWLIVAASLRLGAFPELDISEPWTPVDVVANTLVNGVFGAAPECVSHITPDEFQTFTALFSACEQSGYCLPSLPMPSWLAALEKRVSDEAIKESERALNSLNRVEQTSNAASHQNEAPSEQKHFSNDGALLTFFAMQGPKSEPAKKVPVAIINTNGKKLAQTNVCSSDENASSSEETVGSNKESQAAALNVLSSKYSSDDLNRYIRYAQHQGLLPSAKAAKAASKELFSQLNAKEGAQSNAG